MAANRCSTCGINYPLGLGYCECCGEPNRPVSNAQPHEDWEERVEEIERQQQLAEVERPLIPILDVRVYMRGDHFFISSWDVVSAGVKYLLEPDTLIQVGKQVFEVGGYSRARREYWLLLFDSTASDVLAEGVQS